MAIPANPNSRALTMPFPDWTFPSIQRRGPNRVGLLAERPMNAFGNRAFTLVEVMIAMTIFGLVMIAIYSSWSAILRGSKVGLNAAAEAQRTRVSVRAIRDALTSGQLYMENIRYYWFMADTSGDFAALSLVSRLPDSFPGSGLFGDQIVRRVSFNVEPGANGMRQLVLRQTPLARAARDSPNALHHSARSEREPVFT